MFNVDPLEYVFIYEDLDRATSGQETREIGAGCSRDFILIVSVLWILTMESAINNSDSLGVPSSSISRSRSRWILIALGVLFLCLYFYFILGTVYAGTFSYLQLF